MYWNSKTNSIAFAMHVRHLGLRAKVCYYKPSSINQHKKQRAVYGKKHAILKLKKESKIYSSHCICIGLFKEDLKARNIEAIPLEAVKLKGQIGICKLEWI